MGAYRQYAPLIVRVILGLVILQFGWVNAQGLYDYTWHGSAWALTGRVSHWPLLPSIIWAMLVAIIQFLGGILILSGYQIRWGASLVGLILALGIGGQPVFPGTSFRLQLTTLAMSLSLVFSGAGRFSFTVKK